MRRLLFSGFITLMMLPALQPAQALAQSKASINVVIVVHPEAVAPAQVSTSFSIDATQPVISGQTKDAFRFHEDTSVSVAMTRSDAETSAPGQVSMVSISGPDDLSEMLSDFCREKTCKGNACQRETCAKNNTPPENQQYKVLLVYN